MSEKNTLDLQVLDRELSIKLQKCFHFDKRFFQKLITAKK